MSSFEHKNKSTYCFNLSTTTELYGFINNSAIAYQSDFFDKITNMENEISFKQTSTAFYSHTHQFLISFKLFCKASLLVLL